MSEVNNKLDDILSEDKDHLTIVESSNVKKEDKIVEEIKVDDEIEEFYSEKGFTKEKRKPKKGIFNWIKRLYGVSDEEEDDLEFVYSSYANSNEEISKSTNIVFLLVIGVFSSLIIWAAFADIDELARGNGKVIPTDKIQTVQSLDGGIISEISIKEGQTVKRGDALMKIDTTRFRATLNESKQEYLSLLAIMARLEIESKIDVNKSLPKIKFDKKVLEDSSQYHINEKLLLENRFREIQSSVRVLESQANQKRQELKEIRSNIRKLSESLGYIEEQRKTIKKLVSRGVKSKYDLLDIDQDNYISLMNEKGDTREDILVPDTDLGKQISMIFELAEEEISVIVLSWGDEEMITSLQK